MRKKLRPILIFTSKYSSNSSMNRIGVDNTKILMEKAIFSEGGLGIDEDAGLIIENENYVPACEKIRGFIQSLDRENDICLFYFCGHGYPDYNVETVYLAMTDTTEQNWDTCGYNAKQIISLIKSVQLKHYIIILDCCHSGFLCDMGENKQETHINIGEYINATGSVYIASTTANDLCNQICIEGKYYIPFSYHLANAFMGNYTSTESVLSIESIYETIESKLSEMNYITESIIQCKGKLATMPLFHVKKKMVFDLILLNFLIFSL